MSSLSIRGIDDELSERLKQLAIEEQKSVNSVVLNANARGSPKTVPAS